MTANGDSAPENIALQPGEFPRHNRSIHLKILYKF